MKKHLLCLSLSVALCMNAMYQPDSNQTRLLQILDIVQHEPSNAAGFIDRMIEQGVQLKDAGTEGNDILHQAVRRGCRLFIERCADAGANINVQDSQGRTPLYVACGWWDGGGNHRSQRGIVDLLIERDAKVNIKNNNGMTPLHNAAGHRTTFHSEKIVKALISAGAHTTHKDNNGKTAYDYAASDDIKRALLLNPCNGFEQLNLQQPPIYALQYEAELLKKAIPLGLNINAFDPTNGVSLLWLFFDNIHYDKLSLMEEVLDLFIQYGVKINHKTICGDTILHKIATMEKIPESWVKKIIDAGAHVDAQNEYGEAPLHWAVRQWHFKTLIHNFLVAKLLITYGKADVDILDDNDDSPLHHVVYTTDDQDKQKQMVSLLLFHGADCKKENNKGLRPYDIACQWSHPDIARMLENEEAAYEAMNMDEFFWQ